MRRSHWIVLMAGLLITVAAQAQDAAPPEDPEAAQWRQLRETFAEQVAGRDMVPYSARYRPDIHAAFRTYLPTIERLRRRFVELILRSGRCKDVEQVQLDTFASDVSSKQKHLVFWLDCSDGTTYRADAGEISTGKLPEPAKKGQWREEDAPRICAELLRNNRPADRRIEIIDTQVSKTKAGAIEAQLYYRRWAKQKETETAQPPDTRSAHCVLSPGEYPRISIE